MSAVKMPSFSLVPIYEDHHFRDTCPSSHRYLFSPFRELDHVARQVDRLQRELGLAGGITNRKDVFAVDLDVEGYKPQDLNITVQDNLLTISGRHEEKNEDETHYESRHFTRKFILPMNIQRDKMKACISKDGLISCLRVEAPFRQTLNETKEISLAINHK